MEFRVRHFGGPLVYSSPGQVGPFEGLPLDMVAGVGADGLSGTSQYFNHFHRWEGPSNGASAASGALGGWFQVTETNGWAMAPGAHPEGTLVLTGITTAGAGTLHLGPSATIANNYANVVGKRLWMFTRMKVSADFAGIDQWFMGFGTGGAVPYTTLPTNGIYLRNHTTAAKLDFGVKEGANATLKVDAMPIVLATYTVVGFMIDTAGIAHAYQDGAEIAAARMVASTTGLVTLDATKVMQFMIGGAIETKVVTFDWLWFGRDV